MRMRMLMRGPSSRSPADVRDRAWDGGDNVGEGDHDRDTIVGPVDRAPRIVLARAVVARHGDRWGVMGG